MSPERVAGLWGMSTVISHISVSLDGFAAGPRPTLEAPLGEGGERLHEWALATDAWRRSHGREGGEPGVDAEAIEASIRGVGAHVMGRGMFGGGPGPWDESWQGWWGDDPPFHHPVFVLTHHPREPLVMQGGTTFTFVTDGIEAAVAQARDGGRRRRRRDRRRRADDPAGARRRPARRARPARRPGRARLGHPAARGRGRPPAGGRRGDHLARGHARPVPRAAVGPPGGAVPGRDVHVNGGWCGSGLATRVRTTLPEERRDAARGRLCTAER